MMLKLRFIIPVFCAAVFGSEPCGTVPVDIFRSVNMGFRDETAGDGKGGWSDQGPENDLRSLKPGTIRCGIAEFRVLDPDVNGGKGAVVVGKTPSRSDYASSVGITMNGRKLKTLFLLHAAAFAAPGRILGYIRVTYMDGSQEELPVTAEKDVGNWWEPADLRNAAVAWTGSNESARVGLYASSFALRGGAVRHILFRRSGLRGLWMIAAVSASAGEGKIVVHEKQTVFRENENWRRFAYDRSVEKDSALDFSFLLDAPAGKYGFLSAENGHFSFGKKTGPVRFYGPNLCFSACFPTHEQADILADRFARMGCNVIRLHHFDNTLLPSKRKNSVEPDPVQLDRMEYFIAALKKKGIYITIDLFISRKPQENEFPLVKNARDYKLAVMLLPEVNRNLKTFSRNLLTHRNPYTGLPLVEEPALLNLSIVNENTPFHIISMGTSPEIRQYFQRKFAEKHPDGVKNGKPDGELFRKFLSEVYTAYYRDMAAYLRSLGLRVPLTEQNFIASPNLSVHREMYDYVDEHLYWDHPTFPEKPWSLPNRFHGASVISRRLRSPAELAPVRLFDRPFTVSEFDFSGPGDFRMQGIPIFAAYAALQDWDSLNRFAYSHSLNSMFGSGAGFGSFDSAVDPVRLLGDRLAAAFFLRGDVTPAKECIPVLVAPESYRNYTPRYPEAAGELALVCRTGTVINRGAETRLPPGAKAVYAQDSSVKGESWNGLPIMRKRKNTFTSVTSSTGELSADFRRNTFRAATSRSEALILPEGTELAGKCLTVRNRKSYCVAGAIALNGGTMPESSRILLLHIANVRREGMTFRGRGVLVTDWGGGAMLAQRAVADFSLELPAGNWKLYALDFSGRRQKEVPFRLENGRLCFTADTFGAREPVFAYELIR